MIRAIVLAALMAPVVAHAATPAAPASVDPKHILSSVGGDWNGDGNMDRAVLMANDDAQADLIVYLTQPGKDMDATLKLSAFAPNLVSSGNMFGNGAELRLSKSNALQVYSENMAVGRDHWEQTLTLAYRDGQMVVAGVTYSANDTLDPKAGGSCDVNLLTGAAKHNGKPVKIAVSPVPVAKWTDDSLPKICQF